MPANLLSIKRLWPALAGLLFCLVLAGPAWAVPDIRVSGGGNEIVNGDTTPQVADLTDFGGLLVSSGTKTNTFTIENIGADPLNIASVSLTGAQAGDFFIATNPSGAPIAPAGSANLQILFNPSGEGLRSATVNITSDDPDESPYTFAIQGTAGDPEIDIQWLGVSIPNNQTTPSELNGTDFGNVPVGKFVDHTFTIRNTGLSNLTTYSAWYDNFGMVWSFPQHFSHGDIVPGGSVTFIVRFSPTGTGISSSGIQIYHNDADKDPFNLYFQGTGFSKGIDLRGNGASIANGDATPSAADHTDFGSVDVSSGTMVRTFTIANAGAQNLNLTGSPLVAISGAAASDFTVTAQPATPVAGSATTTFDVTFDPSAAGLRSATINIANDDAYENPYTFAIQGIGTPPGGGVPEIDLRGNGVSIANGDTTPSTADYTYFGNVLVSGGTKVRTFTIANTGSAILALTGTPLVTIGGAAAGDYTVTAQPATPVAVGVATTFDITFNPSAAGVRGATISIGSNDADETLYTFAIQGYGATPGGGGDPDPEPEPEPEPEPDPAPGTPTGTSPNPTTSLNGPSLSWPKVSGASSYRVFRAACPTCAKEEIGRVSDTSFVDQSALPGQVYYYFVRGEGSGGYSGYSDWMAAWRYEQNPGRAGDFNGDGIADLLWWEPDTNELKIWLMNGGAVQSMVSPGAGRDISQWLLINTGDFNNDGVCDIMWWNPEIGAVEVWYMSRMQGASWSAASGADGEAFQATSSPGQITGNSTLSYTGDLNGDGRSDILWRNYETGEVTLWIMGANGQPQLNGPPTLAAGIADGGRPGVTGSLEWGVRGLFDMDGDGKADVIWQHAADGGVVVWGMDGAQAIGFAVFQQDGNWRLAGIGDLDGDGKADFVWSNQESGEIRTWLMHSYYTDETIIVAGSAEAANWQVKAVGEFCSPGCDDVYCKHSETGAVKIVTLDRQSFAPSVE